MERERESEIFDMSAEDHQRYLTKHNITLPASMSVLRGPEKSSEMLASVKSKAAARPQQRPGHPGDVGDAPPSPADGDESPPPEAPCWRSEQTKR
eukprot:5883324-Amphidinium_carterae.2